ncbi:MAG TPA: YihY/virulence factor BrkB family protein [Solirubrobacterales bacterium]|jgi:YihY family inner membrane protein|nr:YihY/virulence factor BrkB family protein [Solirubrobacterales bacterium]
MPKTPSRSRTWLVAFWRRAYRENVTGLAAMVAYNLMLAVFPFSLLVLFIGGQVLKIHGVETSVLNDLERLFPNTESGTISDVLQRIEDNSATIGIAAFVGSVWIGASFWGAMDTAFCRIYHVPCRGWLEQKRFSFAMLGVVLLFIAASIFIPTLESTLVSSTDNLPFGLSGVEVLDKILLLGAALLITFAICSVIFLAVPKAPVPWRSVWPGALFVTFGAGLANWLFPLYLTNVSSLSKFGSTLGFVLIALLWFYVLSLAIMAGAVINSLRYEYSETGEVPYASGPVPIPNPCAGLTDEERARAASAHSQPD